MSDRETVPRGFESPYEQFLWKELTVIRELERAGEYYQALQFSLSLLKYLAPELRKKQGEQMRAIRIKVNEAIRGAGGLDFYTRSLARNRVAQQLGQAYLEDFITMLSDSLGERAYMERVGASKRAKGDGRLRVNE